MARFLARRRIVAIALTVALLSLGMNVVPAFAAETYTMGTLEAPTVAMDDHTPFGVRFTVPEGSGLEGNTTYYAKIRLSISPTKPSGTTNRGFTWNPTTQQWVLGQAEWTDCPTVTTDANGAIHGVDGLTDPLWLYGKVGDETVSGTYYLMISLSKTGSDSTYNPLDPPAITVLDAQTNGSWVHNGTALANDDKRASVRAVNSLGDSKVDTSTIYALWQTEKNLVDDDGDGTVDDANENQGPSASASGDYRMAAPVDTLVDIATNRTRRSDDFRTGPADCDVAAGAVETMPPAAVTGLSAESVDGVVELTWDAGSDAGGSGLAGYAVYRWETMTETTLGYTPAPVRIASVPAGTTTLLDESVDTGVSYSYHVRAYDTATNVGPRSNIVSQTVIGAGDLERVSGKDRYKTALAVSQATFPAGSVDTTVVVATGLNYPDALAAAGLAGIHGSPLLLVGTSLTPEIKAEIDRLGATDVVVVGGEPAVSAAVYDQLDAYYNMKRIGGKNRFATAAMIGEEIAAFGGDTSQAYFVRGDDFADALSVAPFAYANVTPVLLVLPGSVPAETQAAIADLGIAHGMIAGGTPAVGIDTAADLEDLIGTALVRWSGSDRYATAAAVAQAHVTAGSASYNFIGIATGLNFPDALGGGVAAGENGGVLLLTKPTSLSAATDAVLTANVDFIDEVQVFGDTPAIAVAVYNRIAQILP